MHETDHGLEFLLAFDGRVHVFEEGYWVKFEIKRVKSTKERPHGLSYSFTLHGPDGKRLLGFDNAHGVGTKGSRLKKRLTRMTIGTAQRPIRDGHIGTWMRRPCWTTSSVKPPVFCTSAAFQ
jgi:hypothetical protein